MLFPACIPLDQLFLKYNVKIIKKICKNTNIEYVDTSALAEAFFIINKKLKLIKTKKN